MKVLMKKKWIGQLALVLLAVLFFAACSNNESVKACLEGRTYGFWSGLWHGIIAPVDLVGSLFRSDVTIYAPNNNGAWYGLGFLIGSGGWGFLGGRGLGRRR
jgi:hypothetical protein